MSFQDSISWHEFRAVFEPHLETTETTAATTEPVPETSAPESPKAALEVMDVPFAKERQEGNAGSVPEDDAVEVMDNEALTLMLKKSKQSPAKPIPQRSKSKAVPPSSHVLFISFASSY